MKEAGFGRGAIPAELPSGVREPLNRARLLAIQMDNPAVQTHRWAPQLVEWLDQARLEAGGSQNITRATANTIRDAAILVRVLSESSPRDVETYLPELVLILDELVG